MRVVKGGTLLATAAITFNTAARRRPAHLHWQRARACWVSPSIRSSPAITILYLFYTARNGRAARTGVTYGTATVYDATGRAVNRVALCARQQTI